MHKLIKWSAKRSGPAMTVQGVDEKTGSPVKLTDVREIKLDGAHIIATCGVGAGQDHILRGGDAEG